MYTQYSSYKYLGFILADHINFNKHISELCDLVTHKLYVLFKMYLNREGAKRLPPI